MMIHRPIVFVDVETTGFSARDGRVIEIGAVRVENGRIVNTLSELIDPGMDVSWQTTMVTGIKSSDVFGKRQFRAVIDEIETFLEDAIFAAHNVDFDYSFLKEEFARNGSRLSMDRFCTARLSKRLYPEHRSHSLDSVIARHGYTVINRHRALDDASVIAQFFLDQLSAKHDEVFGIVTKQLLLARTPDHHTANISTRLFEAE
jgi:DNA polymerase-3 subunit epsilon